MGAFVERSSNSGKKFDSDEKQGSNNENLFSAQRVKTILFFGDSLTAGYALSAAESFPSIIQEKIDSIGLPFEAVNAGISGDTTSGGNYRIDRYLKNAMDVFVLELGINDGLRGVPVAEIRKNLQSIIDKVKSRYRKVKLVLAGMQVPPYVGQRYADDFRKMFPDLAEKNDIALIPFLLQGVAGIRALNLADGAHPSAAGQKIVANNVWAVLQDVLKSLQSLDTTISNSK